MTPDAKWPFVLLLLAMWNVSAWAADPSESGCAAVPAVVEFTTMIPQPNYIYDKSVTSIQYMMRETGHPFAVLDDTWTLGVTVAKPVFTIDGDIETAPDEEGGCARLAKVRASVGYASMDVYIGSDFKPGTCAFKATYDHEYQHVNINAYTIEEFAKTSRLALEKLASAEVGRADAAASSETLLAPYRSVLEKAVAEFSQVQRSRNAALDKPQSYARTQAQCTDWNQSYT